MHSRHTWHGWYLNSSLHVRSEHWRWSIGSVHVHTLATGHNRRILRGGMSHHGHRIALLISLRSLATLPIELLVVWSIVGLRCRRMTDLWWHTTSGVVTPCHLVVYLLCVLHRRHSMCSSTSARARARSANRSSGHGRSGR